MPEINLYFPPPPFLSLEGAFYYFLILTQIAKLYGPHLGLMWSYLGWYVGPIWAAHMVYVWGIWAPLGPNGTRVGFAPYTPYGHHMGQKGLVWAISGPRDMNPTLIPYNPSGAHTLPRSWYQMGPRWVMWEQYGIDVSWPKWDPCRFCTVQPIRAPHGTKGFGMGYIWAMRHESHINPI